MVVCEEHCGNYSVKKELNKGKPVFVV